MLSRLFEKKTDDAKPAEKHSGQGSLLDLINPSVQPRSTKLQGNGSLLSAISNAEAEADRNHRIAIAETMDRERQSYHQRVAQQGDYASSGYSSAERHNTYSGGTKAEQLDLLAGELEALQKKFGGKSGKKKKKKSHNKQAVEDPIGYADSSWHAAEVDRETHYAAVPSRSVFSFDQIIRSVFRAWLPILLCAVIGFGLAAVYALSLPNKYESVAEILIEPRGLKVLNDSVAPSGLNSEATVAYAESQVRIIHSSSVVDPVIEDLDLANDSEFTGTSSGLLGLIFGKSDDEPGSIADAKEYFYENFYASRVNQTFTILIGVSTEEPAKSARIANAIARQYISEESGAKSSSARDANESLTSRLAELGGKLEKSERAVEDHRKQFDLIDADGKLVNEVQLARLNEQLALAKVQSGDARTRAEQAKDADLADAISGSLPSAISSPAISQLRLEYTRAKSRLDRLKTKLGNRHPDRIGAQSELRSARDAIAQEIKRGVRAAQKDFKRATARQLDLQKQVNGLKASASRDSPAIVRLRELESIATADRRVYETVLLRSRETGEQSELKSKSARIISEATPADKKEGPNRKVIALLGGIGGGALGALLALIPLVVSAGRALTSGERVSSGRGQGGPAPLTPLSGDLYSAEPSAPQSAYRESKSKRRRKSAPVQQHPMPEQPAPMMQQPHPQTQQAQPHPVQMPLPGFAHYPVQAPPMAMPQPVMQPVYVQQPQPMPVMMAQPVQPQPIYAAWAPPQPAPKEEN